METIVISPEYSITLDVIEGTPNIKARFILRDNRFNTKIEIDSSVALELYYQIAVALNRLDRDNKK